MKDLWLTAVLTLTGIGLLVMAIYSALPASVLGLLVVIAFGFVLAIVTIIYILVHLFIAIRKNDHDR